MSVDRLAARSGGVIGTIGPIGGSGVFSLQERYALSVDNYNDVSLYLKMNGANGSTTFYDSSLYGHTVTANGNAQISTAQSKFGGASLYQADAVNDTVTFSGVGSTLEFPGDYTIEGWVRIVAVSSGTSLFVSSNPSLTVYHAINLSATNFQLYLNTGSITAQAAHGMSTNTWHHFALVRQGSTVRAYTDGVEKMSYTSSVTHGYSSPGLARIGGGNSCEWYIDDLRITKGVARYTGNFTPPQREFRP